jgi:hypothetical protein
MKRLLSLLLVASPLFAFSQGDQQEIARKGASEIHINANMSGVHIEVTDSDVISVNHVVTVEGKDRPDLRKLEVVREGSMIKIIERWPNQKLFEDKVARWGMSVSHRRNGEHASGDYNGTKANAYLEVTIPRSMKVTAESLYGGVKAKDVMNMPMVKSVYGEIEIVFAANARINGLDYESDYQNVDVTLPANVAAKLELSTSYGSLYTDFDFTSLANGTDTRRNRHRLGHGDRVTGILNGGGQTISLTSPYQNVYLRKRK